MTSKICKICLIDKSLDDYHTDSKMRDGFKSDCKDCRRNIRQQNYEKNKDRELVQNNLWKQSNTDYNKQWQIEHPNYFREYYHKKIKV